MKQTLDIDLILSRLDDLAGIIRGQTSPWYTTCEAANYLRCSPRQIEKLTQLGLLPFKRQDPTAPKSPRLYHRKHLTAFLLTGKNPVAQHLSPSEKHLVEELL